MRIKKKVMYKVLLYIALLILMTFVLFPYLWLVMSSLKTSEEIFAVVPTLFPEKLTFEGYIFAFSGQANMEIFPLIKNSLLVSGLTAIITCFFAATGGYAIGRKKFPGLNVIVTVLLVSQMFQGPVIMVPWYNMAARMGILNTRLGLLLVYLTMTIPISVWLMSGFFKGVSLELEAAAYVDGANRLQCFWNIALPLVRGGLVSIVIYSFILSWNDYQYALLMINSNSVKTIQLRIGELMGSLGVINWGGIMACGVIMTVPVIVLFAVVQKNLIEGLTAGAVKG